MKNLKNVPSKNVESYYSTFHIVLKRNYAQNIVKLIRLSRRLFFVKMKNIENNNKYQKYERKENGKLGHEYRQKFPPILTSASKALISA